VTIYKLPSVALLGIFDFYLDAWYAPYYAAHSGSWRTLVHVCRRWRIIILGSPRLLNLQLFCSSARSVRSIRPTLDIWPTLPVKISSFGYEKNGPVDNIAIALEHKDRVCEINFCSVSSSDLEKYLALMQEPFLALTSLELTWSDEEKAMITQGSDSFLGGFAPRLQKLTLSGIPIPFLGLQKALLSANDLVELRLQNIPHLVYFSPDAIVTCLSASTNLKLLELIFQSPRSRPVREKRRPPPPTRALLPALTYMMFKGVNEYLEDIVAQIDAPLLDELSIIFFHQLPFYTRQLAQFIGRAPKLGGRNEAHVVFSEHAVRVTLLLPSQPLSGEEVKLEVLCKHPDMQLLSATQLCDLSFPQAFIRTVEHLYIVERQYSSKPHWETDIQKSEWLGLLHPFTNVKDLYLSEKIVTLIAPGLRELVGGKMPQVLPALQCLLVEGLHTSGPVMGAIGPFISARRLSTRPIVASCWDREEDYWWDGGDSDY
jgi:hypothetical protein